MLNLELHNHQMSLDRLEVTAELFTIPLENNTYLIYAPLRRVAFIGNASCVNTLADLRQGHLTSPTRETLAFIDFLKQLEIIDGEPEEVPVSEFAGHPTPTDVTLFLTTQCNLRCTYCYASAGDTPLRSMPLEVATRGIDEIVANALQTKADHIEVNYHGGGEPTVNWDTLYQSYDYARQLCEHHGLGLVASLATNGVMSDKKRQWVIEHLDGVSISFDGLPQAHDLHRLTVSGQGSSHLVETTLSAFDEANFPYGLRMTVTKDQIETLPQSVSYIFDHFNPQALQVEPAYQLGRWKDQPSAETASFIKAYRQAQYEAKTRGRDIQFSGARLGVLSPHFCGVTQDSFCLSTDGNVSACYEVFNQDQNFAKRFFYGKPKNGQKGYEFNQHLVDDLRGQTVDQRAYCKGCFAKWSCGGDCLNKALNVGKEDDFKGTDRCHIIRELTKDQILHAIASSETSYWNGKECISCNEEESDYDL